MYQPGVMYMVRKNETEGPIKNAAEDPPLTCELKFPETPKLKWKAIVSFGSQNLALIMPTGEGWKLELDVCTNSLTVVVEPGGLATGAMEN